MLIDLGNDVDTLELYHVDSQATREPIGAEPMIVKSLFTISDSYDLIL